ncbi:MAG TPA: 4Fe-4S binding protein [Thermodesulfobacteriota bacterium]|nr:4Fe-4S binding protein [Deltaproteobacteria bacterium]HQT97921.1 4Fe-4S binding protein [Thermodesulfobacteriota bacterium]
MSNHELSKRTKRVALAHGADLVGIVKVKDLPEHVESIAGIVPMGKSVIVVASRHSSASIRSAANQVAQFDTIHTYNECARSAHAVSRFLEGRGFPSAAVPAFIPIDMQEPKMGMRGELCWRRAGVRAGIGSYGENGLLVTREFGSAIRISGVLTSADLEADSPLSEDACDHCMRCVEACPSGALAGGGTINKKLCGDFIFKYGFRFFQKFMRGLFQNQKEEIGKIIEGVELREMWQTFMTGNYYYCFECQSKCTATPCKKN